MLNRRANEKPSLLPRASRQRRETMLMSRESFKHLLLKYCQREIRDGRDFCLAGLSVLEYEQVFQASEQAADQLLRLVEDICLRSQREKDRLCRLSSGIFILILPDTDKEAAQNTLDRLAGTLAGAKTHYHQKPLKASTTFRVAHSKDLGANIESLLNAVGCCLDERGTIDLLHCQKTSELPPTDSATFEIWCRRYEEIVSIETQTLNIHGHEVTKTTHNAVDGWSKEKLRLDKFAFAHTETKADTLDKITKRMRVLEDLDHPSINAAKDFQFENSETLWIAKSLLSYPSLKMYIQKATITEEIILDWCHQLLNLIIYLQSLVPPVVPPLFNNENLLVGQDNQLILSNHEANYLFACLNHGEQNSSNTDVNYQAVIVSLGKLMLSLANGKETKIANLLKKLNDPLPKELNTAYKVRQALKPYA